MVFSGIETMGEVPFKHVYVHGLVRDAQGRKMSKSLGNGIDPLEIIEQYGADALRFMLMNGITPGNDMRFVTEKLESSRNFANKLWNASRFVIMNLTDENDEFYPMADDTAGDILNKLKDEDKWILSTVNSAAAEITANMEKFELALASQKIYDLIWNNFCDWYIELVKSRLYGDDEEDKKTARYVLVKVLKDLLKLLHPFMPFITEEIWSFLPHDESERSKENEKGFLIRQSWPVYSEDMKFEEEEAVIELAMDAIRTVRNIRAEADAAPSKKVSASILAAGEAAERLKKAEKHIMSQANVVSISFISDKSELPEEVMSGVINGAEIFINMDELMDYNAELERLGKEKKKLESEVARGEKKLGNEGFVAKAPENVIAMEREKLANYREMLAKVTERLTIVEKKLGK
jgi:valyl-tRNA synthetase